MYTMNHAEFYRTFEEKFYAPRDVIKRLREQYLPYVRPLAKYYPAADAFDIGCGRGEWLELMQEVGLTPLGVDLDLGMLGACVERGLPAKQGDALLHLKSLDDSSQALVTAFHVVEHIEFDQLQSLVIEALRVLKPGGLLIMETPNPENISVATKNFWLDPTHIRPIPPMLLGFLPEFYGFDRVATLRLQQPADINTRTDITLTDVLHHVSPDYAIVAQKGGASDIATALDTAFSVNTGVDLHNLANRFDQRNLDFQAAHHETRQLIYEAQRQFKEQLKQINDVAQAVHGELHALQVSLDAARNAHDGLVCAYTALREEHVALRLKQDALHEEYGGMLHERNALRTSLSWKITAPLRAIGSAVGYEASATQQKVRVGVAARIITVFMGPVLRNEQRAKKINEWLMRVPALHRRLRMIAFDAGLMRDRAAAEVAVQTPRHEGKTIVSVNDLPRSAREIHAILSRYQR